MTVSRAHFVTVAEAASHHSLNFRKVLLLDNGCYCKPSDRKAGPNQHVPRLSYLHQLALEPGLESRFKLRSELYGKPGFSLLLPGIEPKAALEPHDSHQRTPQPVRRLSKGAGATLIDEPRAWLTLDIDELDLSLIDSDVDVLADAARVPDLLFEALDRAGLDWLIADCVIHYSSSFALTDRKTLKAHIDWALSRPLSLADQKRVAVYVRKQCEAAGLGQVTDTVIYDAARCTFTAPPLIKTPAGEVIQPPKFDRVRHVRRGQEFIDVPAEALARTKQEQTRAVVARLTGIKPQSTSSLEPGRVYAHIRASIFALALDTPEDLWPQAIARLKERLAYQIAAMPDADPDITERRLKYLDDEDLQRSLSGAAAKLAPYRDAGASVSRPGHEPSAARSALGRSLARCLETALDPGRTKTTHTLIRVPPGVGKTHAALEAVQVRHLTTQRISYLSPTTRLSEEAAERARLSLPPDDYIQTLVRHHKGRAHLCKEPEYGALAAELERLGRSPVKDVCAHCPRLDACAWPVQIADKASGLVAGQHGHVTTSLARTGPDTDGAPAFGIVDESLVPTVLGAPEQRKLDTLARFTRRVAVRHDGKVNRQQTADLISYRQFILDVLPKAPRLTRSSVLYLAGTVETRIFDTLVRSIRIDDALQSELAAQRGYSADMSAALETYHRERDRLSLRRVRRAANQIKVSQFFSQLYRAIKVSLDLKRDHIWGVHVSNGRVLVHIRQPLPRIMEHRDFVWLDGTANETVWRALFGETDSNLHVIDLPVEPGTYHLTQYPDRPYSRKFWLGNPRNSQSNLSRLVRFIKHAAYRHRHVLVVCQLALQETLRPLVPENVHLEHFNNLRGIDSYRNIPCAIVIGRSMPSQYNLEAMTEALYFDDPEALSLTSAQGQWTYGKRTIRHNGRLAEIPCEQHPDPRAEALRQQLVDAEVSQAVMRLRLFDRTPKNPAEIHVFGQADTGLEVHRIARWVDAERTPEQIIQAAGVVPLNSPGMLARVAGGLLGHLSEPHLQRVLTATRNFAMALEYEPEFSSYRYLSRAMAKIRLAPSTNQQRFVEWSVRIREAGYARRVLVDAERFGEMPDQVKAAIEREAGVEVLSLGRASATLRAKKTGGGKKGARIAQDALSD